MVNKPVTVVMLIFVLTISVFVPSIVIPSSALTNGNQTSNGYYAAKTDKTAQAGAQGTSSSADNWNFNDTSEWSKFAYKDGNKTRLIVGIDDQTPATVLELRKIAAKYSGELVNTVSMKGQVVAAVVELLLTSVTAFAEEVRSVGLAKYLEPNMKVQTQFTPNDPYWNMQWGPKKVQADWAWNVTTGNSTLIVAVVDTGIDYRHPDLAANYVSLGFDWVNMDSNPLDDFGHGTHCAGIIAAVLNNSVGIAGMAQVSIMAEKVLDRGGGGYWDWVANGIIHATDQGAKIISMSLGGTGESELLHDAVKYAYNAGVFIVAAAGNSNSNVKSYPAGYDEVVAVAATDELDYKAGFSNWGDWIELAAPGVNVFSTMPTYHVTLNDYGYAMNYDYLSGTSMACPHVAGLAALVWSQYPNKTRDWVRLWLRYSADDLGESGFDVYYGFGRINARKSVEMGPPLHELIASWWTTPTYVQPGGFGSINATILNFGESDESDITVQLLANDTAVGSEVIEFLASGNSSTVDFSWNPTEEGQYNITLYVEPVPSETNFQDNILCKRIYVGFPVKALVMHSAGNVISEIIANWQVLNSEWDMFGNTMIFIDYTTLDKQDITYEDLVSANADVLIISCAYDPYIGWQFTDAEIDAISQYVHEGHGMIVTAGTFYNMVPNNNKLAALLGMKETTEWTSTGTDLLHLQNSAHPLFRNVPDPLVFPAVGTSISFDGRWDQNELSGGRYLALGHFGESAIVEYRGLVYISPWLEVIPAYYHHHLQLLYNAITWSKYQKPQHELVASLETPQMLKPDNSALLNATVSNMGLSNETNVEVQLLIDDLVVDSVTIPELLVGGSFTLSHLWAPTSEGAYNITAYVVPVPDEDDTANNAKSVRAFVSSISVALLQNYNPWEAKSNQEVLDHYGIPYVVYGSRDFGRFDLSVFTKAVIASDQDYNFYSSVDAYRSWFEDYVRNGGILEIHAADRGWHGGSWMGPLPGGLGWVSFYEDVVTVMDWAHPLLNTPNKITEGELYYWYFSTHGYFNPYPAEAHVIIVENVWGKPAYLELELGRGVILASSQPLEWGYYQRRSLILENSLLYMPVKYEHDLAVRAETTAYLSLGNSMIVNATVTNKGLNTETDVTVCLLINGTVVRSETVSELPVRISYTISYRWMPVDIGIGNVTAYAEPVPRETDLSDNVEARMVSVFFYSRRYAMHEWVGGGNAQGWHGDYASWPYSLPFDFPFYGIYYSTIYISSNGLITFAGADTSYSNNIPGLAGKLAIAAAWEDWTTEFPCDIYIWQNSTHVGIRWDVEALNNRTIFGNFEAVLGADGVIQLNYGYSNGLVSATVGISNGAGHILAEDALNLNCINTIFFLPFQVVRDIAVTSVEPSADELNVGDVLNVTVATENQGNFAEDFTLTAYAVLQDNLTLIMPSVTMGLTRVYFDPPNYIFSTDRVFVGFRFNVTVRVDDVVDLDIWQVGIHYDGYLLNATRWFEPVEDPDYVFYHMTSLGLSDFHRGVVLVGSALMPTPVEQEPFDGSGKLCIIEFEVMAAPSEGEIYHCSLDIDNKDTFLLDPNIIDIPATRENGYYEISSPILPGKYVIGIVGVENLSSGERIVLNFSWNTADVMAGYYRIYAVASFVPFETDMEDNVCYDGFVRINSSVIHDVAITAINMYSNVVYQGWTVCLNASVANFGNDTESFSVTFYCDDDVIGTRVVESLGSNTTLTISFYWNTTNVPYCQNYTLKAVASTVPGEVNTANNGLVYGQVNVRIMGDVDGNGIVNMRDIQVVCLAFGAHLGHPKWSFDADLDQNGRVDMRDIGIVCVNFMKTA